MAPFFSSLFTSCAVSFIFVTLARGQYGACGARSRNTNGACQLGAYPVVDSTVYYAPSNGNDITVFAQSQGTCDSSSYADISFYSGTYPGTLIKDCGCLPLDRSQQTITCQGVPVNSLPAGKYYFLFDLGAASEVYDPFTITHDQATTTVDGGTTTATVTSTETDTVTTTTTFTSTSTSPQSTVTSPAVTSSTTITISPTTVTTTTTFTKTRTIVRPKLTVVNKTTTKTAPCTKATLKPCPTLPSKGKRSEVSSTNLRRIMPKQKNKRQDIFQLVPALGNGPLTVTQTNAPTVVTTTLTVTTTETDTETVTTSTTVQPTPLTSTSYTGITTNMVTTTLPTPYRTRTRYTVTKVTSTKTIGFTVTVRVVSTPICK